MLVLTRKQQQQIKIGDEITVTIIRVKGNTVRVGIEAPRTVRVIRGELPPEGQSELSQEVTIVEGVIRLTDEEESPAANEGVGRRAALAAALDQPRPSGHLPQRRVLNRSGSAPLRVVMSGAVLAK